MRHPAVLWRLNPPPALLIISLWWLSVIAASCASIGQLAPLPAGAAAAGWSRSTVVAVDRAAPVAAIFQQKAVATQ